MKNGKKGSVKEIMMGSPVTLSPEDTLDLANDVISLGRIRHIPVLEDGRLVGLISERDLIGRAVPAIFGLKQKSKSALLKTYRIKDFMRKRVVTVLPIPISKRPPASWLKRRSVVFRWSLQARSSDSLPRPMS